MNICFLTKKDKLGVEEAIVFTKGLTNNMDVYYGDIKDSFPKNIENRNYDLIISYISPWIVPKSLLNKTKKWNINFHPGPPDYPGIGCFNFALFDSAKYYGATAHIMNPKVDTGKIIGVNRFPINKDETVETLSIKTYKAQLDLYKEIIQYIFVNKNLPEFAEDWKRKPYTRNQLEKLAQVNSNMSKDQIEKLIRSTYFPGKPAPFIKIYGHKFEYNPDR